MQKPAASALPLSCLMIPSGWLFCCSGFFEPDRTNAARLDGVNQQTDVIES